MVQECVLERANDSNNKSNSYETGEKQDYKSKFVPADLWKAQQLKEFRRTNGLCFKCGEMYTPQHQCAIVAPTQLKAMELAADCTVLSDDMLSAVVAMETSSNDCHISLYALLGTTSSKTISLRATVGTQTMLLLVDSGSSHSFLNQELVRKWKLQLSLQLNYK